MLSNMRDTALNVFIGKHKLPQCNSITYLGVDSDNVLSWNLQTDSISKKLVFIISRLSRLKPVLPSQMLMYIYTSIIQPKIDYAISIWGYTTAHSINKVQRLQNRAARILMGNVDYVNTRVIAFAYRGPVIWNALPENIKKCETLNCLKQCVKLHVVE